MSDKPEPLAAILAEMRDLADHRAADAGGERPGIELLRSYADRIEAAAERERAELRRQLRNEIEINNALATVRPQFHYVDDVIAEAEKERAHEIELAKLRAPGNAAAMREALVEILDRTNREKARDYDAALNGGIIEIHDIANTALNQTTMNQRGWGDTLACVRSALAAPHTPLSDASKMREAILAIKELNDRRPHDAAGYEINDIIEEALAAPARNCDRFATAEEARKAFQEARGHKVLADVELWDSMDEAGALVRWLFATAEGGAE